MGISRVKRPSILIQMPHFSLRYVKYQYFFQQEKTEKKKKNISKMKQNVALRRIHPKKK